MRTIESPGKSRLLVTQALAGKSSARIAATLALLLLVCASLGFGLSGCGGTPKTTGFYIQKNVAVPMRDGVILRADVRRPKATGRYPVLIFRTPYDKNEGDPYNERSFNDAVKRGYAMVIQDVRGRYASDGEFTAYQNEGKDGYDTIEWAARQSWSDGKVGTFGLSYPGAVQWLAAVENPPHLKAMVPAMCFSTIGPQFIYFGGVFETAWANWSYIDMSPDTRVRKNLPGPKTIDEAKAEWKRLGGDDAIDGWSDVLSFETEPFKKDESVVGHVGADVYVSTDAPDFDLYLKLIDVAPDGTAYNLESAGHEVVRASYRDKTVARKLVRPGEVVKISYDNLLTGNTFKKGHRLRVYIMGSWFPTYSRNLQTGQLETTNSEMKKATINILYGPSHPSRLVLPVAP
jgi:predicted acyl esterase